VPGPLETIRSAIAVNPATGQPAPGGADFAAVAVESPYPVFLSGSYTDQVIMPSNIFLPCNVTISGSLTVQEQGAWINAVLAYGADPTGSVDSTAAINTALSNVPAAGGVVYLPSGSYLVNSSLPLSVATPGTVLRGDGPGQTFLVLGPAWTAAEAVNINGAASCTVRDIGVTGFFSTVTLNHAGNGIELTGAQHCRFQNLWFQYVNGWCIESVAGASVPNLDTMIESFVARNCAGGIHVQGMSGANFSAEHFLTDIQMQQMGTSTGGSANLSALYLQDCQDVLTENLNVGVVAGTGSAIKVTGAVSTCLFSNVDVGGGSGTVSIADSGLNSPSSVFFLNGTIQQSTAGPGLLVTGGAQDLEFDHIYFHRNVTDGITVSNTGPAPCQLTDCRFNTNNQAAATGYDANFASATTKWVVQGGLFSSAVGTVTAGKVNNPVNDPSNVAVFFGTNFNGASTTTANVGSGALNLWQCIIGATLGIGPMTLLGDTMYGGTTGGNTTRLPGNTSATGAVLAQTGTGSVSAAPAWVKVASPASFTPGDPASTTSATLVMMGLGSTCTYTPAGTGHVLVNVTGGASTLTSSVTGVFGGRFGTGTAPANGTAVTGTRFGSAADIQFKSNGVPATVQSFALTAVLSLTPGTAYWFDIALDTGTPADAAEVKGMAMTFVELPT
jgi:hypothetical protein